MSEEAANAAKAVPLGILSSIGMCWGLGFVIVIVLAACMNQDVDAVLGSSFGQPVSQFHGYFCQMDLRMLTDPTCRDTDGSNLF